MVRGFIEECDFMVYDSEGCLVINKMVTYETRLDNVEFLIRTYHFATLV